MRLVSIQTPEENAALKETFADYGRFGSNSNWLFLWTSGRRITNDWNPTNQSASSGWLWSDTNETFTFYDWRRGQPDNYQNEEHFLNLGYDDSGYGWNDLGGERNSFVDVYPLCEVKLATSSTGDDIEAPNATNSARVSVDCPSRLEDYEFSSCYSKDDGSGCYCVVLNDTSWSSARDFCQSVDMDLVSIETAEEDEAIDQLFNRKGFNSRWMWTSGVANDTGNWTWAATGKPVTYFNWGGGDWGAGESNNTDESDRIMISIGSGWIDLPDKFNGSKSIYPLCESTVSAATGDQIPVERVDVQSKTKVECPYRLETSHSSVCRTAKDDSGCYCLIAKDTNWDTANQMCREHNMRLVSIETKEEDYGIREIFFTDELRVWTSAVVDKSATTGERRWNWSSTGQPITYFHWTSGGPDSDDEKDRIFFGFSKYFFGWLNVNKGRHSLVEIYTLCEATDQKISIEPIASTPPPVTCPESLGNSDISSCHLKEDGSGCYCLIQRDSSWDSANAKCRNNNMRLVSIETEQENAAIRTLFANYTDFGVSNSHGLWFWTSAVADGSRRWKWTATGKPINFFSWNKGEPNNDRGREDRISIAIGSAGMGWNDLNGEVHETKGIFPMCESTESETADDQSTDYYLPEIPEEPENFTFCPDKVNGFNFSSCHSTVDPPGCYCLIPTQTNWTGADEMCRSAGLRLVSIQTPEENAALNETFGNSSEFGSSSNWLFIWTSGRRVTNDWNPTNQSSSNLWLWSDTNEPITDDWWSNKSDNLMKKEDFLLFVYGYGEYGWGNSIEGNVYPLCEVKLAPTSTGNDVEAPNRIAVDCPSRLEGHEFSSCYPKGDGSGCYCVILDDLRWSAARHSCQSAGMDLVSIETAEENAAIDRIFEDEFYLGWLWTSGVADESWNWTWAATGKPVTYSNWIDGEPNNTVGSDRISIIIGSGWIDLPDEIHHSKVMYPLCESTGSASGDDQTPAERVDVQSEIAAGCPDSLVSTEKSFCYSTENPAGCYCFFEFGAGWEVASTFCGIYSMPLVSIETAEENAAISRLLTDHFSANNSRAVRMWTSAAANKSASASERRWTWSATDEPLDFFDWNDDQSDNYKKDGHIYLSVDSLGFGWNVSTNFGVGNETEIYPLCEVVKPVHPSIGIWKKQSDDGK